MKQTWNIDQPTAPTKLFGRISLLVGNGFVLENLEQWNASWLRQSHLAHRQMYRLMMLMVMLMVMIVDFDFDLSSVWSCPHSVRGALAKGSLCKVQDHK